jgi:hypothetical protein
MAFFSIHEEGGCKASRRRPIQTRTQAACGSGKELLSCLIGTVAARNQIRMIAILLRLMPTGLDYFDSRSRCNWKTYRLLAEERTRTLQEYKGR